MNSSNPEKDNPIASKGKGWGGIGICLPLGEGRDYDPYRLQCGLEQLPSLSQPQSRGERRQPQQAQGTVAQGVQRTPVEAHDGHYALRCRGGCKIRPEIPGP